MHPAPFIWSGPDSQEAMAHVYFRREFTLAAAPDRAEFHLYADTNYHLYVNGEFVGFGPARSYPEYPEFDTYDLTALLMPGENVIAVHVLHVGVPTFHNLVGPGGFAAWGAAKVGAANVLFTTERNWLCERPAGFDPNTITFSFAQAPIQVLDEREDIRDWQMVDRPAAHWRSPVILKNQDAWGELRPRSIPNLTQEEQIPQLLLSAWKHSEAEQILSFRINQSPDASGGYPPARGFCCSWIHSPRAQKVTVGTFWGEYYLNGRRLGQQKERPGQMLRTDADFDFVEGWNFFFGAYGIVQAVWEMHLAVPVAAELTFSASQNRTDPNAFLVAGPFTKPKSSAVSEACPPENPDAISKLVGGWQTRPRTFTPVSPQRNMAWAVFRERLPVPAWQTSDLTAAPGAPTSFVFDMGKPVLGRIFVEYDAPAGTVLDVGIAEDLRNARPDYSRFFIISAGERQIAGGGPSRMETFYPRGFRYLQLMVSNAGGPVTIRRIGVVSQLYPYALKGRFECSDPYLTRLWEYGAYTLRLCSEDVLTDCPWRERTLYAGDMLTEAATTAAVSGDMRLVRRCLDIFLQSQSPENGWMQSMAPITRTRAPLSDYPLITVVAVEWYCRLTSDLEFARRAEPVLRRQIESLLSAVGEDGLLTPSDAPFIDWIDMDKQGALTTVNAVAAAAMGAWAALLETLGKPEEAAAMRARREITARAVRTACWDAGADAFADRAPVGGEGNNHYLASNAWPLLFGASTPEQDEAALRHMRQDAEGFTTDTTAKFTSPYGAFYILGAAYLKGDAGFAETSMRRFWSEMLIHPTGTVWEWFNRESSLAHAWSSAPTFYLSTRALGVRLGFPEAETMEEVLIAPESETLQWAKGDVPHPAGTVHVEWAVRGDRLELEYVAPAGARVRVEPRGRLAQFTLYVNGSKRAQLRL